MFRCYERVEALHEQSRFFLINNHSSVRRMEESQARVEESQTRMERSQTSMQRQLQSILAYQQRRESPVLSQSLDASSPEGRETWMNLGRLLRAEGITPAMIKQNRDILVKAIRITLQEDMPSSSPDSYRTAFESFSDHQRSLTNLGSNRPSSKASLNILGSAPPRSATFTDEFLDRHRGGARSLDQAANIEDGMQSLLQGMETATEREKQTLLTQNERVNMRYCDDEDEELGVMLEM